MTLSGSFVAAAGSVTGRDHRRAERDGQDGHALVATDDVVAAVVTDGCSSGRTSEIGARVGAAWLAALVEHAFAEVQSEDEALVAAALVTGALLERLERLARSFDPAGNVSAARVEQSLLFGFLVAVVTPRAAVVFGIGDGVVVVDGKVTAIDPGPENAPPYLAYGLVGGSRACIEPRIHFVGATADVSALAVATDGAAPLVGAADGSLADVVADPRYAKNPSLLRKRLVVLSDRGTFSDDATIALVRRAESMRPA
jgi:hypothetical protein